MRCIFTCLLILLAGCASGPSGPRTTIGGIGQGSTKPYYVRGSWHYPQNFYEYDETGIASWYGPGFHGKPKPYGEPFDMNGLSAAHRTLPLPSVVKVTNLSNGRSINIVVDDRGPFVYEGRIIDLSIGAAKELGTYSKGLATVRVQSLPSESKALSDYLAKNGDKRGKMKDGRTWQQVYRDEIAGQKGDYVTQSPVKRIQEVKEHTQKKATIDELENLIDQETSKPLINTNVTKQTIPNLSNYIVLGETYLQKANAEKVSAAFPKTWNAQVNQSIHTSGQTFYDVRIGPIKGSEASQAVLQHCKEKGFAQAILVKD